MASKESVFEPFDTTSAQDRLAARIRSLSERAYRARYIASIAACFVIGDLMAAIPPHQSTGDNIVEGITGSIAIAVAVERGIKSLQLGQRVAAHEMVQLLRDEPMTIPREGLDSALNPGPE